MSGPGYFNFRALLRAQSGPDRAGVLYAAVSAPTPKEAFASTCFRTNARACT